MCKYSIRLEELLPIMKECLEAGRSFTFSPHGISMLPMLRDGIDTVTLSKPTGALHKYDLPLYRRPDGKFILHRIVKTGATYTCIGDNQFCPEKGVDPTWIIAVVTSFTRDGKKHSVEDRTYRLYCIFWHHTRLIRRYWRGGVRRLKRYLGKD